MHFTDRKGNKKTTNKYNLPKAPIRPYRAESVTTTEKYNLPKSPIRPLYDETITSRKVPILNVLRDFT